MENVKIRKDLNDMVNRIQFEEVGTAKYPRKACVVTLFTGKKLEFTDKNGELYDYFVSFHELGDKDFIESVKLVEQVKKNDIDFDPNSEADAKTYFCVLYTLKNGEKHQLYGASKFTSGQIKNYYEKFKKEQAEQKKANASAQK